MCALSTSEPVALRSDLSRVSLLQEIQLAIQVYGGGRGATEKRTLCVRFTEELRTEALQRSLDCIVERHEILRTAIRPALQPQELQRLLADHGGLPADSGRELFEATVRRNLPVPLEHVNLRERQTDSSEAHALELASAGAEASFEPGAPPFVRARLITVTPTLHLLTVTLPRFVADLQSLYILERELVLLYKAFRDGTAPQLEAPSVQFGDYCRWQRGLLRGSTAARLGKFWQQYLAGGELFRVEALHFAKPEPEAGRRQRGWESTTLQSEFESAVRRVAKRQRVTLFTLLVLALSVVLHGYTGKRRIGVLGMFANRRHAHTRALIGPIAHALPIVVEMDRGASAGVALKHVQRQLLNVLEHQELPFGVAKRLSGNKASKPSMPVGPGSAGNWRSAPHVGLDIHGHAVSYVEQGVRAERVCLRPIGANSDLALKFVAQDARTLIRLGVSYDAQRFNRTDVRMMVDDVATVLSRLAANGQSVGELAALR